MSQQAVALLIQSVQQSIDLAQSSSSGQPDDRALKRVLAHLWSVHDELQSLLPTAAAR